jgi:hypothetical protein
LVLILALFDLPNYDSASSAADKRFIATVCFIIIQPISHYLVQTDLMGIYRSRGFPYCRLAMLHFYPDCQKTNLKIDSSCFRSIMKPPHNTYNLHSLVHHLFYAWSIILLTCNPNWIVRFERKILLLSVQSPGDLSRKG